MNDLVEDDPVKAHLREAGRKGAQRRWSGTAEQRKKTAEQREAEREQRDRDILAALESVGARLDALLERAA